MLILFTAAADGGLDVFKAVKLLSLTFMGWKQRQEMGKREDLSSSKRNLAVTVRCLDQSSLLGKVSLKSSAKNGPRKKQEIDEVKPALYYLMYLKSHYMKTVMLIQSQQQVQISHGGSADSWSI